MSLKKILGLEQIHIDDTEIMRKIVEAKKKNIETIEFSSDTKKVKINISNISPNGMMWQHQDYWDR